MLRYATSFLLLILLTSACSRSASSPPPTQPAVNFPTIAPESIPPCVPEDLETSSNTNGTPESFTLGVTLTNRSKNICRLSNPPQISLLSTEGKPIELIIKAITVIQTPPAPATIQLVPSQAVIITLIWQNYCQPLKNSNLILRLKLVPNQDLDIKMKLQTLPVCQTKSDPSVLLIAPYSVPP